MTLPVLYSFRRCPYAMRARLALLVSKQPCELREVSLKSKPVELLKASPKATVPVLVLPNGQVIEQSLEIMRWALSQHDPEGWLQADTPSQRAWLEVNDTVFKHALDRYKYPNRYASEHTGDEAHFALKHRAQAADCLMRLQACLAIQPWLGGASPGLADMAILPFVRQFAEADKDWFARQAWPQLHQWLTQWQASPLFEAVMQKYAPWQPGQSALLFRPAISVN